ncbi:hypothetical protein [Algivirga pacifica]|uniref:NTF2 fold immunity protein domain-containing protein n=1 Tax=Algivirga pacifica TaxID=1162670 RepID=A0ABP9DFV9_9BACT
MKREMDRGLNIDSSQTTEKFLHLSKEVIEFLIENLIKLHELEQEIFERSQKLQNPAEPNQLQAGEKELWDEYKKRHGELISAFSMSSNMERGSSFGKPTKYEYLLNPDTKFLFIMKSALKAVVETQYEEGIIRKDQFILKKDKDGWKVNSKKYGFLNDSTWYKDEL